MKALAFIDHDIICRHFVISGALRPLTAQMDVVFVFPDDGGRRVTLDPAGLPLGAPWLRLPIDPERQRIWRWALFADQLKWRRGAHEAAIRRLRWSTLGWKAASMLTLATLPGVDPVFHAWVDQRLSERPNRALAGLLDREQPDVIIHPSVLEGVFINDLVLEGRLRRIPVVVAMNSWDNPSTKRAVVGRPDWLLVWGPQTRAHAMRFMGMDPSRIVDFGAAQFDIFRKPTTADRTSFCEIYGFDPRRPIVLFAGANTQTDEFATIGALDDAIDDGRLPPLSLLYRPHPWGGGGRGGSRLLSARWKHVKIDLTMRAYVERIAAGNSKPELPDYAKTHDLLSSVDAVVSPLSTMLVEAMLHGKPPMCFLPEDEVGSSRLRDAMPMLHFEDFLAIPEVTVSRSVRQLIERLPPLIDPKDSASRAERLRQAAQYFVASFEAPWGDRLSQFLRDSVLAGARREAGRAVA